MKYPTVKLNISYFSVGWWVTFKLLCICIGYSQRYFRVVSKICVQFQSLLWLQYELCAGVTVTRDEMNCWTCQHAKSESVFYFSSVGLLLLLSLLSLISIHSSRVFRGNYPMHGDLSHHLVNSWWQEQGFPCRTSGFLSQGLRDLIVYIILMTCTRHKRSHPALPDLKDLTQTSLVSDVEVVDLVRKTPDTQWNPSIC